MWTVFVTDTSAYSTYWFRLLKFLREIRFNKLREAINPNNIFDSNNCFVHGIAQTPDSMLVDSSKNGFSKKTLWLGPCCLNWRECNGNGNGIEFFALSWTALNKFIEPFEMFGIYHSNLKISELSTRKYFRIGTWTSASYHHYPH